MTMPKWKWIKRRSRLWLRLNIENLQIFKDHFMNKNLRTRILLILGIIAASVYFTFPLEKHINLGLDLKGGMHLVLKVETEKIEPDARQDAVARAIEILRNRIDGLGVGETVIQRQG